MIDNIEFAEDPYAAIEGAGAVVVITEWDQFRALDLKRIKNALNKPVVIDLRNIYAPEVMEKLDFCYASIGRPTIGG